MTEKSFQILEVNDRERPPSNTSCYTRGCRGANDAECVIVVIATDTTNVCSEEGGETVAVQGVPEVSSAVASWRMECHQYVLVKHAMDGDGT